MGEYFEHMLGNITGLYQPEDMYLGGLFGAFEKLYTGTTTALDWSYPNTLEHAERAVDALQDTGLRAVYTYGPAGDDSAKWWYESDVTLPEQDIRELYDERISNDDLLTLGLGLRGPDFCVDETACSDLDWHETWEPSQPSIWERRCGPPRSTATTTRALAASTTCSARTSTSPTETTSRKRISTTPSNRASPSLPRRKSRCRWATASPSPKKCSRPAVAAWGVDVCSNISGDMTSQMRIGLQVQRMFENQAVLENDEEVTGVQTTARDTLEMATIEGAKALNLEDEIGTLTPGKRADIITIRTDDFMTAPCHSPIQTVVFQSDPSHIDTVLVDGEPVKRNGELLNPLVHEEFDRFVESGERSSTRLAWTSSKRALEGDLEPLEITYHRGFWVGYVTMSFRHILPM